MFLEEIDYFNISKIDRGSILDYQLEHLLYALHSICKGNTNGDIVELGCNVGETSKVLKKFIEKFCSEKKLYVYDSFEGLPETTKEDYVNGVPLVKQGILKTNKDTLIFNFNNNNIELPFKIVTGWFSDIPHSELPAKVAFVFLDGDLYSSTLEGLELVWPRMEKKGRVYVHDVGHPKLPGVKKAIDEFSEKYQLFFYETCYGLGYFTK